jgi:hypothetical protein
MASFGARLAHSIRIGGTVEPDKAPELTMVCAWCARVLVEGTSGEVSHGICDQCLPGVVTEILERLELEKQPGQQEREESTGGEPTD